MWRCWDELHITPTYPKLEDDPNYVPPPPIAAPDCDSPIWDDLINLYGDDVYEECLVKYPIQVGIKTVSTDYVRIMCTSWTDVQIRGLITYIDYTGAYLTKSITFDVSPPRPRAYEDYYIGEGYLLSVTAYVVSDVQRHAAAFLTFSVGAGSGRAYSSERVIAAGYASIGSPVCYPGTGVRRSTDGSGDFGVYVFGNPEFGDEIKYTLTEYERWRISYMQFDLVTSAAPGDRDIALFLGVGTGFRIASKQPPSTTRTYRFMSLPVREIIDTEYYEHIPMPIDIGPNDQISTQTDNLDDGDRYVGVVVMRELWTVP